MVMIFVLTLWLDYNTITEPHACFILSLVEDISIYFPLHVIASILDCYQDTALRDVVWFCFSFSHFMYHSLVTTCTYIIALMMYAFFTFVHMCCFFSPFIHMFFLLYNLSIFHTWRLDESCLIVSVMTSCKSTVPWFLYLQSFSIVRSRVRLMYFCELWDSCVRLLS